MGVHQCLGHRVQLPREVIQSQVAARERVVAEGEHSQPVEARALDREVGDRDQVTILVRRARAAIQHVAQRFEAATFGRQRIVEGGRQLGEHRVAQHVAGPTHHALQRDDARAVRAKFVAFDVTAVEACELLLPQVSQVALRRAGTLILRCEQGHGVDSRAR